MFGLGVQELLIILVIALVFFGAEKIPQLAKSLGKGMAEFKKAQQDLQAEIENEPLASPTAETAAAATPLAGNPAGEGAAATPPAVSYIQCPACNQRTVAGSLFCSQCGKRLTGLDRCSLCQRQLQPDEKFCPNCGSPRDNSREAAV